MALINMSLYNDLERDVASAIKTGETYSIRLSTIKQDVKKRKAGWTARVVILSIWAFIIVAALLLTSGIIDIGGGAQAVDPDSIGGGAAVGGDGAEIEGGEVAGGSGSVSEPEFDIAILSILFVPMTWTLCFVGFPIGWNMSKDDRNQAKDQIYVQHTIYEDGSVDTYESSLVPKLSAFIFSLFLGCITMAFSVPIAIVQCFTWKGQIKKIESIVADIEGNPELFVCE